MCSTIVKFYLMMSENDRKGILHGLQWQLIKTHSLLEQLTLFQAQLCINFKSKPRAETHHVTQGQFTHHCSGLPGHEFIVAKPERSGLRRLTGRRDSDQFKKRLTPIGDNHPFKTISPVFISISSVIFPKFDSPHSHRLLGASRR